MIYMSRSIISEGRTSSEAIEKGLKELGISKENADIKILEEKKKSFFNILDPHIVKVEITEKEIEAPKEKKARETVPEQDLDKGKIKVENFLKDFLGKVSEDIDYTIKFEEDYIVVELLGKDATKLIGYRGETLNSLQLILSNIAANGLNQSIRVIVDIEGYREKRRKTLEELAIKIEKTVRKTGKKVTLEPMTPYERKIIHTKLQDSEYVRTFSIGEESDRRVVIAKK